MLLVLVLRKQVLSYLNPSFSRFLSAGLKLIVLINCWSVATQMNGAERKNNTLKHSYLQQHKTNSLTGMLTVVVEDFLPDKY